MIDSKQVLSLATGKTNRRVTLGHIQQARRKGIIVPLGKLGPTYMYREDAPDKLARYVATLEPYRTAKTPAEREAPKQKRLTKYPSYRYAVEWIAQNDEAGNGRDSLDPSIVNGYVTTLLVADLFGCDPELVAQDIVSRRRGYDEE